MIAALPDVAGLDPTRQWLTMLAHTHITVNGTEWSPAQWLLDHGHSFEWSPLPRGVRRRDVKRCFWNSLDVVARGRGRYVYVEGYATNILPVEHAWCVDRETGLIVDTTWTEGAHYLGVPVKAAYARQCLRRERAAVWNWQDLFPIMTGVVPAEIWKEKLS